MVAIYGSASAADLLEACAAATSLGWVKTDDGYRLSISNEATKELDEVRKTDQMVENAAQTWSNRLLRYATMSLAQITARKKQIGEKLKAKTTSDAELSALEYELDTLAQLESPAIQALVTMPNRPQSGNIFGIDLAATDRASRRVVSSMHRDASGLSAVFVGRDSAGDLLSSTFWVPVLPTYSRSAASQNELPTTAISTKKIKPESPPQMITIREVAQRLSQLVTMPVIAWDSRLQVPYAEEFAANWNDQAKFIAQARMGCNFAVTRAAIILRPWEPAKVLRESPPERALRAFESIPSPTLEDAAVFTKQCSAASIRAQKLGTVQSVTELQGIADASPALALWLQLDSPQRESVMDRHALSIEGMSQTAQRLAHAAVYDTIVNVHGRPNGSISLLLPPAGPPNPIQIYMTRESKVTYAYRVGNAVVEATADQISEEIRRKATERSKLTFTMMIGRSPIEAAVYEFSLPVARPKPTKSPSGSEHE